MGPWGQESICETQKDPYRPAIRRGIEYFVNAHILNEKSQLLSILIVFGHFTVAESDRQCQGAHLHTKAFIQPITKFL